MGPVLLSKWRKAENKIGIIVICFIGHFIE